MVKKPRARVLRINPETLTDTERGLHRLYKDTKGLSGKDGIESARLVGRCLEAVKIWADDLMPRYDFDYFCERVQKVGSKPEVQKHLSELRALHLGQIDADEFVNLQRSAVEERQMAILEGAAQEGGETGVRSGYDIAKTQKAKSNFVYKAKPKISS